MTCPMSSQDFATAPLRQLALTGSCIQVAGLQALAAWLSRMEHGAASYWSSEI